MTGPPSCYNDNDAKRPSFPFRGRATGGGGDPVDIEALELAAQNEADALAAREAQHAEEEAATERWKEQDRRQQKEEAATEQWKKQDRRQQEEKAARMRQLHEQWRQDAGACFKGEEQWMSAGKPLNESTLEDKLKQNAENYAADEDEEDDEVDQDDIDDEDDGNDDDDDDDDADDDDRHGDKDDGSGDDRDGDKDCGNGDAGGEVQTMN